MDRTSRSNNHIFNVEVDPYIRLVKAQSGVLLSFDPTGPEKEYADYINGEHMWFMANHPCVAEHIREEYSKWGLAVDEFT